MTPPTLVASLAGDRGLLTVLDNFVIWQSMTSAQRWDRGALDVSMNGPTVRISAPEGEFPFVVEQGDAAALFGLAHVASAPGGWIDDGMDAETRASVHRSFPSPAGAVLSLAFDDRTVPLTGRTFVVGRGPSPADGAMAIAVDDQTVSRTHAWIVVEADHILVTDLDSSNGTFIHPDGGPEVSIPSHQSVPVHPGTRIGFGDAWCLLEAS